MQDKKRYLGPNEVSGVIVEEAKTPAGGEIVKVLYSTGSVPSEIMPMKTFEILVTDVPKDWNWVRETRYASLLGQLASVALENDVMHGDIDYLCTQLREKLKAGFSRAVNFLWTGDDKQYVPGLDALALRSLLEADMILKRIKTDGKPDTNTVEKSS